MTAGTDVMRLATWNIWWRYGEWRARRAAIVATLKRIDADVIALNEVWEEPGGESQAAELGRELGLHSVARCMPNRAGLASGNAVLSRWPIRRSDSLLLGTTRCALHAEIESPQGALSVFVTHLTWRPGDSRRRQEQLHEVLEFVQGCHRSVFPPILMGDLNAEPGSDELRTLTGRMAAPARPFVFLDLWEQVGDGTAGHTWDRSNVYNSGEPWPSRRLDYILAGLPAAKSVTGWFVPLRCWLDGLTAIDEIQPSDHYAAVAELRAVLAAGEITDHQLETLGDDHVAG